MASLSQLNQPRLGDRWACVTGRLTAAWRVVGLALLCMHTPVVNGQAQPLRDSHNHQVSPGAIGHQQPLPGEPLREYYSQPVRIIAPGGATIAPYDGSRVGEYGGLNIGLQVGTVYRFHVYDISNLEGQQLYPSIEAVDRLYPPSGREQEFPIPVELAPVDLRLSATGKYVTRVIYVEDPDDPFPYDEADPNEELRTSESQRYFEVPPGTDPYVVAAGLGRPVAILRIGNRAPSASGDNHDFAFGSHPFHKLSQVTARRSEPKALWQTKERIPEFQPQARNIRFVSDEQPQSPRPDSFIPSPLETEIPELEQLPIETGSEVEDNILVPQVTESPRRQRLSRLEKLFDGGDRFPKARVQPDWNVLGLDAEDTVVHYDTLGGSTEVVASNRVAVYSPRFAAVRQVKNLIANESVNPAGRLRMLAAAHDQSSDKFADIVKRDEAPIEQVRDTTPQGLQDRNPGLTVERVDIAKATVGLRPPFTGVQITHTDELFLDQLPLVENYTQQLAISNEIQSVQVIIDTRPAMLATKTTSANEVFEYELPDGKARMRIIKIASTTTAKVGDTVRFTIRFDNVGDEAVGNVTILDNLTTRFVYRPDSQTCDVEANFSSVANQHQSHRLRWEVLEPLEPGQGGTIRFECRVR